MSNTTNFLNSSSLLNIYEYNCDFQDKMEEDQNKIKIPEALKTLVSKSRKKHEKRKEKLTFFDNGSGSQEQFSNPRRSIKHHSQQKNLKNGEFKVQKLHFYASKKFFD